MSQRREASDSRASQWLREVVSEVSQTAALNGLTADRACAIGRPSGKADYLITVGPLVDSVGELEHGLACAIAFVADQDETTRSEERRVGKECVMTCKFRVAPEQ